MVGTSQILTSNNNGQELTEHCNSANAWSTWEMSTVSLLPDSNELVRASDPKWYLYPHIFRLRPFS
jgi:hypothetical protein